MLEKMTSFWTRSRLSLRGTAGACVAGALLAAGTAAHALDANSQKELEAVGMAATVAELCAAPTQDWEHLARFQELAARSYAKVMEQPDASVKTAFTTGHQRAHRYKAELSQENCEGLLPRIKHTNGLFADTNELLKKMITEADLAASERVVTARLKKAQETNTAQAKRGRLPSGVALPKPGSVKPKPAPKPAVPLDLP